jgi:hypothetical protein
MWKLEHIISVKSSVIFIVGLSNPLDMMYHIQPWMMLSLLPLSTAFEGLVHKFLIVINYQSLPLILLYATL